MGCPCRLLQSQPYCQPVNADCHDDGPHHLQAVDEDRTLTDWRAPFLVRSCTRCGLTIGVDVDVNAVVSFGGDEE